MANGHQKIDRQTSGEVEGFYDGPRGKIDRTFSSDDAKSVENGFQESEEALQRISRSAEVQEDTYDSIEIGEDIRDHIKVEAGLVPNSFC